MTFSTVKGEKTNCLIMQMWRLRIPQDKSPVRHFFICPNKAYDMPYTHTRQTFTIKLGQYGSPAYQLFSPFQICYCHDCQTLRTSDNAGILMDILLLG